MYTCTSMYWNTHTSFMQGHSTRLPFTTTTSLTTLHCATFIELFLLEHLRYFFVLQMIDNDEFFVGNTVDDSHAQRAAGTLRTRSRRSVKGSSRVAGGSLGAWRTSVSASRHNMNHENFPNWRLMTIILIHSSSNRSLWRRTPERLVCRIEGVA